MSAFSTDSWDVTDNNHLGSEYGGLCHHLQTSLFLTLHTTGPWVFKLKPVAFPRFSVLGAQKSRVVLMTGVNAAKGMCLNTETEKCGCSLNSAWQPLEMEINNKHPLRRCKWILLRGWQQASNVVCRYHQEIKQNDIVLQCICLPLCHNHTCIYIKVVSVFS